MRGRSACLITLNAETLSESPRAASPLKQTTGLDNADGGSHTQNAGKHVSQNAISGANSLHSQIT